MKVKDLISINIPELSLKDNVENALNLMDEFDLSHLPVITEEKYIGLVDKKELEKIDNPVKSVLNQLIDVFVLPNQHIYDAVKLFSTLDLTVLPVKDENDNYLGCITLENMVNNVALGQAVHEPGGIIVLQMNQNDYSMQEIAGIVESNNSKILSTNTHTDEESGKLDVTIKVSTQQINGILQTFERYNYFVKSSFQEHDYSQDLINRYDEFMKYLNM